MNATATSKHDGRSKTPKDPAAAKRALRELSRTARSLQGLDAKADHLRHERNQLIYKAVEAGATEREAATKAGVSPTYAHRVCVSKGEAVSGHNQNKTFKTKRQPGGTHGETDDGETD